MNEKQFEMAQQLETAQREHAINCARKKVAKHGTSHCIDCGDEIPKARRDAAPNAMRCIDCQSIFERVYGR